jgi:ADP-heptose:LPS heptosyltransferase
VIFRALQLGDMLCAVPALTALRNAYPDAHITLIGLPWASVFVERYSQLIDELMVFPGAVGFPEQVESNAGLPALYEQARVRDFDLAIQLHGSGGVANDIVEALGARRCAGFVQPGETRSGCFIEWPDALPEPARYIRLMAALGVAAGDAALWLPLNGADRAEANAILHEHANPGEPFVVVHPGAQLPSRRWPPERFAAAADAMAALGHKILVTGTAAETPLARAVCDAMSRAALSLAGKTSLGGMAALVERASLVICNDTGISHIAAALKTASVVIACGSETARWSPLDTSLHRVLADYPACRPCMHAVCPHGHVCADAITVEQVISAAKEQLAQTGWLGAGAAAGPVQ